MAWIEKKSSVNRPQWPRQLGGEALMTAGAVALFGSEALSMSILAGSMSASAAGESLAQALQTAIRDMLRDLGYTG